MCPRTWAIIRTKVFNDFCHRFFMFTATECENLRTCKECHNDPSCGWCNSESNTGLGQCMSGRPDGAVDQDNPSEALPDQCPDERWFFTSCPCKCDGLL